MGDDRTIRPKISSLNRFRRFQRLRGLRCFSAVEKMLRDGYQAAQVADYVQSECGEYKDIQRDSLAVLLSDYRKEAIWTGETVSSLAPRAYLEAARKMKTGVKIVDELEELYRVQKARIDNFAEIEEQGGVMLKGMSREIDAARLLLDELHRIRLDLGLDERQLGTLTIKAEAIAACEERYGARFADVLRDPEKRRRVVTFIEIALRRPPAELPEKAGVVEAEWEAAEGSGDAG